MYFSFQGNNMKTEIYNCPVGWEFFFFPREESIYVAITLSVDALTEHW